MMKLMNEPTINLIFAEAEKRPSHVRVLFGDSGDSVATDIRPGIHNAARFGLLLLFEIKLLGNDPLEGGIWVRQLEEKRPAMALN